MVFIYSYFRKKEACSCLMFLHVSIISPLINIIISFQNSDIEKHMDKSSPGLPCTRYHGSSWLRHRFKYVRSAVKLPIGSSED